MKRILAVLLLSLMTVGAGLAQDKKAPSSDDLIYDQVRLKLAGDPLVNGGAIDVDVKDGGVTLKGKVKNEKAREKAERLAKRVKGVKAVQNQLAVDPNAH